MQANPTQTHHARQAALPPVVKALLCINIAATFIGFNAHAVLVWFALWPATSGAFMPWQWVTYGFLHGSIAHLCFNMLAFWMFGTAIERVWGSRPFLLYYMVCIVGAALVQTIVSWNGIHPTIGASGGTFGLLLAFGWMFPRAPIYVLLIPIPIQARYFVIIYGAVELYLGFSSFNTGIAHFAHLGGMLFGVLLILYWLGRLPIKPRRLLRFR